MKPRSVLILDDHAIVRQGLRLVLEQEGSFVVAREAASLPQAVAGDAPDVILTDLRLVGTSGAPLVAALRDRYPDAPILVLSMVEDPVEVRAALAAGANGYLLKASVASELIDALTRVADGQQYVQPSLGAALARPDSLRDREGIPISLSERELDVLRLVALGYTNGEIATKLDISPRTVEAHRASLMRATGATTRAELVRFALDANLLDKLAQR